VCRSGKDLVSHHGKNDDDIVISIDQSLVRSLLERGAELLKQLQQQTSCKIYVREKTGTAHISSNGRKADNSPMLAAQALQHMCEGSSLSDSLQLVAEEVDAEMKRQKQEQNDAYEQQVLRQVFLAVGGSFSESAIREALEEENWDPDLAHERLYLARPALDPSLLQACRAANARRARQMDEASVSDVSDVSNASSSASKEVPAPKHVQAIRDVFAAIERY